MSTLLKQKQEEIDGLLLKANEIYEAIGQNEPTTDQKKSVIDINKEIEEKEHAFLELEAMEKGREAVTKRLADMRKPVDRGDQRYKGAEPEQKADPRTLGDAVLGDEGFKQWLGSVKNGNTIRQGQFGNSPAVEVKALITGASSTSAGAFVRTDYDSDVNLPYRTLNIRDIITVGQTDSDLVEFVRMVSRDNQAAPVAEATATSGGTGVKPESDLVLEVVARRHPPRSCRCRPTANPDRQRTALHGAGRVGGPDRRWFRYRRELHGTLQHHRDANPSMGYRHLDDDPKGSNQGAGRRTGYA
jgi:hypothetical protein